MTGHLPVTIGLRERPGQGERGGHVEIQVFVGRNLEARGNAGTITLRVEEWEEIQGYIDDGSEVIVNRAAP
jgi:hypothetical protein